MREMGYTWVAGRYTRCEQEIGVINASMYELEGYIRLYPG